MTAQQRTADELRHVFPMRRNKFGIAETVWTALCGYDGATTVNVERTLRCPTCARLSGDSASEVGRLERLIQAPDPLDTEV